MHILRIALKTVGWIVGILLLILLLLVVAIQIPAVQNKALGYAIPTISDLLGGAEVDIAHIDLDFFDAASVEGVYIADQRGDTLLYARELSADIGAFSLFGGELFLDEIALDGAYVNAYQENADSGFNYQFILDAFAPSDTAAVDTSAAAFTFGLSVADVTNTRVRLRDDVAGTDLTTTLDRLYVEVGALDLDSLAVALDEVAVSGLDLGYVVTQPAGADGAASTTPDSVAAAAPDSAAAGAPIPFPYAGLPIELRQLTVEDVHVAYRDATAAPVAEGFDPANVEVFDFGAEARNFFWTEEAIALEWESLGFRERSGLTVTDLDFDLELTPEALSLDGFAFATDQSRLLATAALDYASFEALTALDPQTRLLFAFDDSYVAFNDMALFAPTLEAAGVDVDAAGNVYLSGQVAGTFARLQLEELNVRVGQQTAIAVTGVVRDALDPERLSYRLNLKRFTSSYADARRLTQGLELPPALSTFGRFTLSGTFAGTADAIDASGVRLETDGRTGFRGDFAAQNLSDPDNLYVEADVQSLTTRAREIAPFVPDSSGIVVDTLGDIDFAGQFAGTLTKFEVDGTLTTGIGSARTDLVADLTEDYSDGSYVGNVALDSFNVGALLGDTTIGRLTLDFDLDGEGLAVEEIASSLDGTIGSFEYNGYTYTDIEIHGNFDEQVFEGAFSVDDPNVSLQFDGYVNVRDSIPDTRFVLDVDTIALEPLGFYPTPLGVSMQVVSSLRGNSADNLTGRLLIDDLQLSDSTRVAVLDSLLLRAGDTTAGRYVLITSDLLDAGLIGDYAAADLPVALTNYIDDYFPIDEYVNAPDEVTPAEAAAGGAAAEPVRVSGPQNFEYYLSLSDPTDFTRLFDVGLDRLDTVAIAGSFDKQSQRLTTKAYIPDLDYAGTAVDTILMDLDGTPEELGLDLRLAGIAVAGQEIELALTRLALLDDELTVRLTSYLEGDSVLLATGLGVTRNAEGRYVASLAEDFEVAGQHWTVDPANTIEYWDQYLDIDRLTFEKDGQRIGIQSDDESGDADVAPITVTIADYQLAEVARLVQLEGFSLDGLVDGTIAVRDPVGDLYYEADIDVADIVLNEQPVGTLTVDAANEGLDGLVTVAVGLDGPVNDLAIAGKYGIADGSLDFDADLNAFELRVLDPIMTGVISDSEGLLVGDLEVTGTVEAPAVNGYVGFEDAATTYDLLGIHLGIAKSRIDITEETIDFGTFVVVDSAGREATLSGSIAHDYFADFAFDLNLKTEAFTVLNTEPTLEELYYGKAVVKADVDIDGTIDVPEVTVNATTLAPTELYIQPLITSKGVSEEEWVIYAAPAEYYADTANAEGPYAANALGIDLGMQLTVTDETEMHIIVDPGTGDALYARGNAELAVDMNANGDVSTTGVYEITEGAYQFTFVAGGINVQQKNFDIREGSNLQFVGDPLDTRFDITAVYTTETTTAPLITAQSGGGTEDIPASAKRRQPVNVLMIMKGDLENPDIGMDIEVPEASSSATDAVQDRLAQLRQHPDQLYQQVFGLLVLNSFIGGGSSSGGGVGGAAQTAAFNSVSNLVANQLNSLADNYLGGIQVDVGLESYENYDGQRTNQANIDLSKSLLDDRLTITIGTESNVGGQEVAGAETAGFQSNFVLSYQFTESGHYLLKAFRRPDYDVFQGGSNYETGVGVSYSRQFK